MLLQSCFLSDIQSFFFYFREIFCALYFGLPLKRGMINNDELQTLYWLTTNRSSAYLGSEDPLWFYVESDHILSKFSFIFLKNLYQ